MCKCCFGIAEIKNRPVVFTSTFSREKPAHTPDTLHVQPLSCKLEWTNQKHFYCFLLKPIKDNLAPGFPRALDLSPLHAQKSSGHNARRATQLSRFTLWHNGRRAEQPSFIDACTRSHTHFPKTVTNHAEKYEGLIQGKILLRVLNVLDDSTNTDR